MHPARERALVELQVAALAHLRPPGADLGPCRACVETATAASRRRVRWRGEPAPGLDAHLRARAPARRGAAPHAGAAASLGRLLGQIDARPHRLRASGGRARAQVGSRARRLDPRTCTAPDRGPGAARAGRALPDRLRERGRARARPACRRSVIHGDANDYNVLVGRAARQPRQAVERHRLRRHAPRPGRRRAGDRRGLRAARQARSRWPRRRTWWPATTAPSRSPRPRSRCSSR